MFVFPVSSGPIQHPIADRTQPLVIESADAAPAANNAGREGAAVREQCADNGLSGQSLTELRHTAARRCSDPDALWLSGDRFSTLTSARFPLLKKSIRMSVFRAAVRRYSLRVRLRERRTIRRMKTAAAVNASAIAPAHPGRQPLASIAAYSRPVTSSASADAAS